MALSADAGAAVGVELLEVLVVPDALDRGLVSVRSEVGAGVKLGVVVVRRVMELELEKEDVVETLRLAGGAKRMILEDS